MRLDLETAIRYPDGERAGILRRIVLDEQGQAASVVMATGGLISRSVIVPLTMLREDPGGVLTIVATGEQVDDLAEYTEETVPAVPEGWEFNPDPVPGADVFPGTLYEPVMPVVEMANIPEGSVSISQGTEIQCLDGRWGVVDEVIMGEDGELTAIVGRPDSTEEHDRLIPLGLVSQFSPDSLLLNCTIADLPTYAEELVMEQEEPEQA